MDGLAAPGPSPKATTEPTCLVIVTVGRGTVTVVVGIGSAVVFDAIIFAARFKQAICALKLF